MGWGDAGPVSDPDKGSGEFHRGYNTVREVFENEIRYDFDACDDCEDIVCPECNDWICPVIPPCENYECPVFPACENTGFK